MKLNDVEFEKKKIEEDFAQYKHKFKMEKEKEIRRWEEICQQLKNNLENSKESSNFKL